VTMEENGIHFFSVEEVREGGVLQLFAGECKSSGVLHFERRKEKGSILQSENPL